MVHAIITVVVPFPRANIGRVNEALRELADDTQGNRPRQPIADVLDRLAVIHYMSIVAVDSVCPATLSEDPRDRDPVGNEPNALAHLLLEVTADGGEEEVLKLLVDTLGYGRVLNAAGVEWKPGESPTQFLVRHCWRIGAGWTAPALGQVHVGSPGMTVRRILRERDLAKWIAGKIDEHRRERDWREQSPRQRLERIRREVWAWTDPRWGDTKWAFAEEPAPVMSADPANPWNDKGYNLKNPQAVKAGLWILRTFLWPFVVAFFVLWAVLAIAGWRLLPSVHPLWSIAGALAILFSASVAAAGLIVWKLRRLEKSDHSDDQMPPSDQVVELMKQENYDPGAQNHMCTISRLKPGWIRRLTLRLAFTVVGSGGFVSAPGFLGKNGVIHSARWMRLPGTSQLVFWSNFDNTWESYVADFIADAPTGVSAIWSNCRGFPRTEFLFSGGAKDRDRLVHWARRQQVPTLFWYSAYPELTNDRIRANAAIRQGLASAASDADVRDWLALFGSAKRPAEALDLTEIPTLVFGGLSNRPYAECHIVRFNTTMEPVAEAEEGVLEQAARAARDWLATTTLDVTFGEAYPEQLTVVAVALSASGLQKLQVPKEAMATFSTAFQQGMWPSWRARELGDLGNNDPQNWEWGGNSTDQQADALVLLYAKKPEHLEAKSLEFRKLAANAGHQVKVITLALPKEPVESAPAAAADASAAAGTTSTSPADGQVKPGKMFPKEPFGFADGVSQPIIVGAPGKHKRSMEGDFVAPGEIVMGYPDNVGTLPSSPSVADRHDPQHYLPDRGTSPFRRRPEFSRYEPTSGERDLGANGTYLVVRQLEQDGTAFTRFIDDLYARLEKVIVISTQGGAVVLDDRSMPDIGPNPPAAAAGQPIATPGAPGASTPFNRVAGDSVYSEPINAEGIRRAKEFLAAKLVGRWPDGSSLVRNPQRPASDTSPKSRPDNAFLLGAEDPRGLACPFGSHIRRANPRDTRFHETVEESKVEIDGVNRHRILRIGRPFVDKSPAREGLMFMCLNADIERQFEFIQKTWLLNRNIHGLQDEVDPVVGTGKRHFTIPTPSGPLRFDINVDFVKVIGGGYFFMPGHAALRYLSGGILPRAHGFHGFLNQPAMADIA